MAMTYYEAYLFLARGMRIICEPEGGRFSWEAIFEEFTGYPDQPIRASLIKGKSSRSTLAKSDTFHVNNCARITILTEADGYTPFRFHKNLRATEGQEWKMRTMKIPRDFYDPL